MAEFSGNFYWNQPIFVQWIFTVKTSPNQSLNIELGISTSYNLLRLIRINTDRWNVNLFKFDKYCKIIIFKMVTIWQMVTW